MNERVSARRRIFAAALAAAILFAASGIHAGEHAGPGWEQRLGITGDAANRNADLVRRAQNRQTRDINRVNSHDIEVLAPQPSRYR